MSLVNSTKLQPVNRKWGQAALACPLHVSLFFSHSRLRKISLAEGSRFELFAFEMLGPFDISTIEKEFVTEWFASFLAKKHTPFPIPLEADLGPFTKKVLESLKEIPMGETLSYRDVAESLRNPKAARAVGNACKANPFPLVIPCHRVVQTGGKLGGFAYGQKIKRLLLDFERK